MPNNLAKEFVELFHSDWMNTREYLNLGKLSPIHFPNRNDSKEIDPAWLFLGNVVSHMGGMPRPSSMTDVVQYSLKIEAIIFFFFRIHGVVG